MPKTHGLDDDINASAGGPVLRMRGFDDAVSTVACGKERDGAILEKTLPIRLVRNVFGQRSYSGKHYSFTMGAHVQYESLRELRRQQLSDADPDIVGIHSQPFRLVERATRRVRRYTPDYALVSRTGKVTVVEVKPPAALEDPKVADCLQWALPLIRSLGWDTEVHTTEPDAAISLNMRDLDGFRDPGLTNREVTAAALEAVRAGPHTVDELVEELEEQFDCWPVLPAVRHLIWRQQLHVDLTHVTVQDSTQIHAGSPHTPVYLTDEAIACFRNRIMTAVR